ncbi:uncharacterized membrane protein YhaH (DUF805 family) [Arthrobacter globiformis]|uniref:DUF805 domain-containing protein n=1 Tax=Arthrobacter globiformis TaxID=1665 RepID=UPI0027852450|nr:DUF805 domain-containing protein [Arthrobacter globiformis]MDQ1058518.1 uncharacterized membrane protein YhaH (DUF805 family) [Arthrobacter globiformis]
MSQPQYPSQQPYPQQQQSWQGEPPLWAPYYGAPFPVAVKRFFKKYATFSGRASRSEYWWWTLVSIGVSIILNIIISAGSTTSSLTGTATAGPGSVFGTVLLVIWGLATLVPSLALSVRRLHDGNFSGWLLLLVLVPFLGAIAVLVFMILPSNPAGQRFDQPGVDVGAGS